MSLPITRRALLAALPAAWAISTATATPRASSPEEAAKPMNPPPAPLYRDPIYDGAADPTFIWNHQEKQWWILYTQRRANVDCLGVGWCHGSDIGIASTPDQGRSWRYRGVLEGMTYGRGRNTFWAPEVLWHDGAYHAYVSFVPGVPNDWSGDRYILHYTSANLWDWQFRSKLPLTSDRVIDACVHRLPNGKWRLWYKDEAHGSHQYAADSGDLFHWKAVGPTITDIAGEGPNVFLWRGWYWMVFDTWQGLGVRRSRDCESWTSQEVIMREPGTRPEDGWLGQHADVLVQDDRAYLLYFVHPQRNQKHPEAIPGVEPYATRRTSLQVAELEFVDGKLTCDRNKPFDFTLQPER